MQRIKLKIKNYSRWCVRVRNSGGSREAKSCQRRTEHCVCVRPCVPSVVPSHTVPIVAQSPGAVSVTRGSHSQCKVICLLFAVCSACPYRSVTFARPSLHSRALFLPLSSLGHCDTIDDSARSLLLYLDTSRPFAEGSCSCYTLLLLHLCTPHLVKEFCIRQEAHC